MKWFCRAIILVLVATIILKQSPGIESFQDVDIEFNPYNSPYIPEYSVNDNCIRNGGWDRWHDACNARLVKGI